MGEGEVKKDHEVTSTTVRDKPFVIPFPHSMSYQGTRTCMTDIHIWSVNSLLDSPR